MNTTQITTSLYLTIGIIIYLYSNGRQKVCWGNLFASLLIGPVVFAIGFVVAIIGRLMSEQKD